METGSLLDESNKHVCASCAKKLDTNKPGSSELATIVRPMVAPRKSSLTSETASGTLGNDSDDGQPGLSLKKNRPSLSSGTPQTTAKALAVGKMFGRYEIVEEVSRGSFGVVYRAQQRNLDRSVALKVLLAGSHASPEAIARFQREARAVARLKHPCIVPVYETGMEDGHHYFAMEFIEGHSLSDLIDQKAVRISEALSLTEQLADAIHSAHGEGVIHRDIKPSNIIVDPKGAAHLTDFGLAKQVDIDTKYTQSGTTLGTPAYMPPEQARGEIEAIDARSDVYSLGAVLYELLTGKAPFAGRTLLEVVIAVINEPIRPPRELNPKIHRDVQTIVMKCLEKDPSERYPSAAEFRDDIRRFRAGEAITARPIGLLRRSARVLRRHAFLLGATAMVLFTLGYLVGEIQKVQEQKKELEKEKYTQDREDRKKSIEDQQGRIPQRRLLWWHEKGKLAPEVEEPERALIENGFVPIPARFRYVYDFVDGKLLNIRNAKFRISPVEKQFIGDFDATLTLSLDEAAAKKGFRVGIQSTELGRPSVPFILTVKPGLLSLAGPSNLHGWILSGRGLRMTVHAEKRGPLLVSGTYTVKIQREGLFLRFGLEGPTPETSTKLQIWDLDLCHWVMKRVVLSLRSIPAGCDILNAKIFEKTPPLQADNFQQVLTDFYRGEGEVARRNFEDIASGKGLPVRDRTSEELVKIAQAHYHLGLLQEILQPYWDKATTVDPNPLSNALEHYNKSLETLERAIIAGPVPDQNYHEGLVRLRKLKIFFQRRDLPNIKSELVRIGQLDKALASYPLQGKGLREPFGWQFAPIIRRLVPEQLPPVLSSGENPALKSNQDEEIELALSIFKQMGLTPGWHALEKPANRLALYLAHRDRIEDLKDLHREYPNEGNQLAFMALIHKNIEAKDLETALSMLTYFKKRFPTHKGPEFLRTAVNMFIEKSLRVGAFRLALAALNQVPSPTLASTIGRILRSDASKLAAQPENVEDLGLLLKRAYQLGPAESKDITALVLGAKAVTHALVLAGHPLDLKILHQGCRDLRLATVFSDAVRHLALSTEPPARRDALVLLAYCRDAFPPKQSGLSDVAYLLAQKMMEGESGENSRYFSVLKVYNAYPIPELLKLALDALKDLNLSERHEAALAYYRACRAAFIDYGPKLMPSALEALAGLTPDARENALNELKTAMADHFKDLPDESRKWRLEFGDMLFILNLDDEAEAVYQALASEEPISPAIRGVIGFRLGVLRVLYGPRSPEEMWIQMAGEERIPEEAQLAGKWLGGKVKPEELPKALEEAGGPNLFTRKEWTLMESIRRHDTGQDLDQTFKSLNRQTRPKRSWAASAAQKLHTLWEPPKPKNPHKEKLPVSEKAPDTKTPPVKEKPSGASAE